MMTLAAATMLAACDEGPTRLRPGVRQDEAAEWTLGHRDVSPHREGFVATNGATIHYLDWGGSGAPLVLLTGKGDNAHVFDDIAPRLAPRYRVIAITRRGYGQSSRPANGYGVDTLVDDDVAVLDRLHLGRVYLAAHSIGAQEMTRLAVRHPERVARLVYVEGSLNDRSQSDACQAMGSRGTAAVGSTIASAVSSPEVFAEPQPTAADLASFDALMRFQRDLAPAPWARAYENRFWYAVTMDGQGRITGPSTSPSIDAKLEAGACVYTQEFSRLRMPALAIAAMAGTIQDIYPWVPRELDGEALAIAQYVMALVRREVPANVAGFAAQVPDASTLVIPNSNHYVFIRDQEQVVAAVRTFLPPRIEGEKPGH